MREENAVLKKRIAELEAEKKHLEFQLVGAGFTISHYKAQYKREAEAHRGVVKQLDDAKFWGHSLEPRMEVSPLFAHLFPPVSAFSPMFGSPHAVTFTRISGEYADIFVPRLDGSPRAGKVIRKRRVVCAMF